jgi:RNA polymerase sigma factor (sigma-70 family)
MAKAVPSPILQLIRRADEDPRVRELPDRELLARFAGRHDEAAFQALLGRHGPMVLDVCRGVLGDSADAENAFQATFLVLVRKTGSIRKTASLGSWLHGVAYRTALKAKARLAGRHRHEARVPARQASEPADPSWREVQQVLHEELSGLPERYRAPLVLCYLEGATQEAAAVRLNLAKSTLRVRLERGRALLRTRLVRRGLGPAAFLATAAWPTAEASAGVPASLAASTVRAAALIVAGDEDASVVSARVADLAQEMGHTMTLANVKAAVVVAVVVGLLGAGSVALLHQGVRVEAPPPAPAREAEPADAGQPAAQGASTVTATRCRPAPWPAWGRCASAARPGRPGSPSCPAARCWRPWGRGRFPSGTWPRARRCADPQRGVGARALLFRPTAGSWP